MLARTPVWQNPLSQMSAEMDRLFESMISGPFSSAALNWTSAPFPPLNLWEDAENWYIEAEVPGLSLEQIELTCTGNTLTISGSRRPAAAEGASYLRRERGQGRFEREVTLPYPIDASRVQARAANGVLTVTVPKSDVLRPRKIQIRAQGNT